MIQANQTGFKQDNSELNTSLLQMRDISKDFSGVTVLKNVQFDLKAGEVHILAGENGAGKSTLIKILAGVHTQYSGQIFIDSKPVRFSSIHQAAAAGISVIHQELSLVPSMSVADNILLGREKSRFHWLSKKQMCQTASALVSRLGISLDITRSVEDFPISTQQMIEICKSLAFHSKIIVMDEPTSALTDVEVEKLFSIIKSLKESGCGIIYITHKMEEIYRIADRITVLRDGQYIGTAKASELNASQLIKLMVGRDLNRQFPRHRARHGDVVLDVKDFSVMDPAGKQTKAVSSVSFSVRKGEILGLAGLQGSGNSELLNGLFGTYGAKALGTVEVNANAYIPSKPAKAIERGLSLLTNDRKTTGLVSSMNIVHNTTLAALKKYSAVGMIRHSKEFQCAQKYKRSINLKAASLKMRIESLSGGNQQKVAIAKWIETKPKVFFLDEPTRGIDIAAKHDIYELMNSLTAEGVAIVLITSELPELLAMSDRIIVMHRGKITAELSSEEATQEKILQAAMG